MSWVELRLDARGLIVTLVALTLVLVLVAVPGLRLLRRFDLARLLTHKGVLGGAPRHGHGATALIAAQVAVVVILAAAALPIAISAYKLADVRSGLADDQILVMDVHLSGPVATDEAARDAYADRVREALRRDARVAGVARVGMLADWRVGGSAWSDTIWTDAAADPLPIRPRRRPFERVVSADYFAVTGLPLLAGGTFDAGLRAGDEPVAVLAAETARRFWPGQAAVGRRFRRGAEGPWIRVVGVVGDQTSIWEDWDGTEAEAESLIYLSDQQAIAQGMQLYLRVHQLTPAVAHALRGTVERVDLTQPVARARRLADELAMHRVQRHWIAVVLGSGAVTAVLLAMTGVVGLVSYYTTARLPELALRVALGAPLRRVVWLVSQGTLRSVAIGLVCGSLTLATIQKGLQRFAFGTSTFAPLTLVLIAAAVLLVALVALLVPLRRLQRLSPQELLRSE